jgi:hypothetical protein
MGKRPTTVIELLTLVLFGAFALRWAWTRDAWYEPYTVICSLVLICLGISPLCTERCWRGSGAAENRRVNASGVAVSQRTNEGLKRNATQSPAIGSDAGRQGF